MNDSIEEVVLNTSLKGLRSLIILFLSVGFLGIGMLKLVDMPEIAAYFKVWKIPKLAMFVIGAVEVILSIGIFYLPTRIYSIYGVIMLMIGASGLHLINGEYEYLIGPSAIIFSAVILLLIERKQQQSI